MIEKFKIVEKTLGNSPLIPLKNESTHNIYAKLEFMNFTGSIKVWPAYYILLEAIKKGQIKQNTTIIESSSGNFAIALATICKMLNLKFIPVIDPNINKYYMDQLEVLADDVEMVTNPDHTGGYLLSRLERVKELISVNPDSFWPNQYENINNSIAHYHGVGKELAESGINLDYAFISVSSGGTITGVSQRLKEAFPQIKIIAVDTEGSVIFGQPPKKRTIPGIGSSIVPPILKNALIDDIVIVSEENSKTGCCRMMNEFGIFAGGSSGSAYYAIMQYLKGKQIDKMSNIVFVCADNGGAYINSVYNRVNKSLVSY